MNDDDSRYIARYWAGLPILERLGEDGAPLSSEEVRAMLGTRSVKGIGAAFSQTRQSLEEAGVRLDEVLCKRTAGGRTAWCAGPRIAQGRHVLRRARRRWLRSEREDGPAIVDAPPGHPGPVLVLRALKSTGAAYRINGDLDHLEAVLDDEGLVLGDEAHDFMGEIFIERIEPGEDGVEHRVPEGYEENGIWIRGEHDYAHPRVAGAIGSGRYPAMMAYIAEARWVERRIVLDDAAEQVETVTAEDWAMGEERWSRWREVGSHEGLRYVNWIAPYSVHDTRSAPPLRMRLRCWYEVVIETRARKRIVLREEGLRGDNVRTASRALERWRGSEARHRNELVVVRDIRVAKSQPRPMARESTGAGG